MRTRIARWLADATRSVFRIGWPRTDKDRAAVMISSLFLHVHPARVSRHRRTQWRRSHPVTG